VPGEVYLGCETLPQDGNLLNWALAHDMEYYMRRLAELGGPTASLEEGVTFSA